MDKNFWKKSIVAGIMLATSLLCTSIVDRSPTTSYAYVNVIRGTNQVNITNTNLSDRLRELLGKNANEKFYANDFLTNVNYKPITTTDSETGVEKTTANRSYLDLSGADIDDISELAYFELPSTLVAIDLSGNNIDNSHLTQLQTFLQLEKDSTITYNGLEITSKTNFKDNIKKINLNFNKIDLDELNSDTLGNTKLLYGIQNLDMNASGLILKGDLDNVKYYIRTDDDVYLSYNFYLNDSRYNYTVDSITSFNSKPCGDFQIDIANPPISESGYFYGLHSTLSFTMFDIYIKSDFKIERKNLFNLRVNPNSASGMDIIIEGLDTNVKISYTDPQTNKIGTSYVNLIVIYGDKSTSVKLPFTVVDTTLPTITLKGYQKMYWKQNKSWTDPGYLGLDSGDDLSQLVDINLGGLDVTTCGTYTITYTLRDLAGNEAESISRTVIVQEQVLDELIITSNKSNYSINDEIILTVQPATGSPISNYSDFNYSWYIDGVLFKTSKGDNTTGKSSITLILDKSLGKKITAKLTAKQKIDNSEIMIDSETFELSPNLDLSDNTSIIIACAVAVIIIVIIIVLIYYLNAKKSKQKISGKKLKKNKTSNTSQAQTQDIQVIKDYNNPNDNQNNQDGK